jgi:large subunit ribosomal protein L4
MTDTMVQAPPWLFVERCNDSGELLGVVQLDEEYFGALVNVPLLHQVVTAQLAAKRSGTHSTKTRAEVSGGGAKPYKQKGTGRARQGTTRAPQFTGGGIAFGPKPRDYSQATPRKMVRQALRAALSDRAIEGRICLVDHWSYEEPKTKAAKASLEALGLDGRILLVLGSEDVLAERSFANLPQVDIVEAAQLTAYDVVVSDWVVFSDDTLPGQASDAPEGTVAYTSARPAVSEPDEDAAQATAVLGEDEETVADMDEEPVQDAEPVETDAVAEPEIPELELSTEPEQGVVEEEPAEAPKPKARARTRKPVVSEPAETEDKKEGK